jgi:hypothetical protein
MALSLAVAVAAAAQGMLYQVLKVFNHHLVAVVVAARVQMAVRAVRAAVRHPVWGKDNRVLRAHLQQAVVVAVRGSST